MKCSLANDKSTSSGAFLFWQSHPTAVEALTLLEVIKMAKKLSQSLLMEGDALNVMKVVKGENNCLMENLSHCGNAVRNFLEICVFVKHVSKSANSSAHALARKAIHFWDQAP